MARAARCHIIQVAIMDDLRSTIFDYRQAAPAVVQPRQLRPIHDFRSLMCASDDGAVRSTCRSVFNVDPGAWLFWLGSRDTPILSHHRHLTHASYS